MNLAMIGIDHSLAPVEIRERFSFTTNALTEALEMIHAAPEVAGCVLLSTCNRTELWISFVDGAKADLAAMLCRTKGLEPEDYRSCFVNYENEAAVHYLYEMTSGLHSLILGEDQILAQVKKALEFSRNLHCTDSVLEALFRSAITAAKKVKSELLLSTANASAVEVAVRRMAESGYVFSGKRCLVIGNGEMGKRAAEALTALGAEVTVTIRQYRSGVVEIPAHCARINYGERYALIPQCDLVVSATSSPNMTIRAEDLSQCLAVRALLIIDLAVPRDVDPKVQDLPGVTLYNIDDFHIPKSQELESQVASAQGLIREQEQKFLNWYGCRDLLAVTDQLGAYFARELDWRMGETIHSLDIPAESEAALQNAMEASAGKILKKLIFAVRDKAGVAAFRQCVEAMEEVAKDG